jgi:predicted Rossmann fold flavoprotein
VTAADVIVVGAGAAGLMCAIEAGKRGRSVIVLERNASIGEKIRISGGGRCNFTNVYTQPENFISENPSFHKSALARFRPEDFIRLVERHRIAWHEKKLGQLFCDHSSRDILGLLKTECAAARARIETSCQVERIQRREARFHVFTNRSAFDCASLVIATGGLSIPKIGATDFAYRVARQFGLRVTPVRPGLVPLLFDEPKELHALSGLSFEADVRHDRTRFHENVLFTHRGLSGPAILQISSYWKAGDPIEIESAGHRPRRLAQVLPEGPWTLTPSGTEGYTKAEVTVGGIDTRELSSQTMEARSTPGLYFIGEAVDVTGHLGGFNFQWAWASGFAAGQNV